jgi:hypothetical protein
MLTDCCIADFADWRRHGVIITINKYDFSPKSLSIFFVATTSYFRWNATGTTVAGITNSGGVGATQLKNLWGIHLDSSNSLFIADMSNHRVQKWLAGATSGTTVAGFGNGSSSATFYGLYLPADVDVDSSGNVYVADTYNHRVVCWNNGTTLGTVVAGDGRNLEKVKVFGISRHM